jgi:hypothetical protein
MTIPKLQSITFDALAAFPQALERRYAAFPRVFCSHDRQHLSGLQGLLGKMSRVA